MNYWSFVYIQYLILLQSCNNLNYNKFVVVFTFMLFQFIMLTFEIVLCFLCVQLTLVFKSNFRTSASVISFFNKQRWDCCLRSVSRKFTLHRMLLLHMAYISTCSSKVNYFKRIFIDSNWVDNIDKHWLYRECIFL